ncbi:MAG: helix-turn-helix transcriptional regulator [Deltaproteobacteria bacterium]
MEEEFAVFEALIAVRQAAGLSQAEVAQRMKTRTPAIARLESAGGKHKPSPTLNTLRRYANAVGCKLEIRLWRRVT